MSERERFCIECDCRLPENSGRSRVCSDECRDIRKRRNTVEQRHMGLRRLLYREHVPFSDSLWHVEFFRSLLADETCAYCRGPLSPSGIALDRIVTALGHRCFNVVACCSDCNQIKSDDRFSFEEMSQVIGPAVTEVRRRRSMKSKQETT